MNPNSPAIQLCIQVTQAEYQGNLAEARALARQSWDLAQDDYERCVAAHYVARFQDTAEERLRWNQEALDRANKVDDERVKDFYPSLYLNLGRCYEDLGDLTEARRYYDLAESAGSWNKKISWPRVSGPFQ